MAPNDNLTAVLHGIEDLRLENQKIPDISDDGNTHYKDISETYFSNFIF
jgi:hypothetical protein